MGHKNAVLLPTLWSPQGGCSVVGLSDVGEVRGRRREGRHRVPERHSEPGERGGSPAAGSHLTLSMVHSCTVKVSNGGNSVQTVNPSRRPPVRPKGGKRGKCKGFSRAARRNLLKLVGSIDLRQVGNVFFITLTAKAGTMDWAEVERRRRVWEERLKRLWSGYRWFAIWKKEPHANGSPHLHYVVYFLGGLVPNLLKFRDWKDAAWSEICGGKSWSQAVLIKEKDRGVAWYVSKYCAKPFDDDTCGKVWGYMNKKMLPVDLQSIPVRREVLTLVERQLVKLHRSRRTMWRFFDPGKQEWSGRCPRGASRGAPRWALEKFNVKCRSWRPRVFRNHRRKIWEEVEDQESGRVEYRRGTDEVEAMAPSLHFADAETVKRLIAWAEAEFVRRLTDLEDLPPF